MCPCSVIKFVSIIWLIGVILIPLLNSFYKGKTGTGFLDSCSYDRTLEVIFWPFVLVWRVIILFIGCTVSHYKKLCDYIEYKGRQ